ncbi:MAG: helix-turn-helix domain-containing protein [Deltaproteobacteria bacterium]|jgi:transcriptional regulator with XRE-family HTH domain|nr:helix-turn-helix domain-containing protein [Deltaproteobacteria bacterium]
MFDPKKLGRRLKSLRLKKGLSQDKLGELAGLNGKFLGEVERGNANISILNLSKLADGLGVTLLDILAVNHEQNRSELISDLRQLIENADDQQLKIIHRLIEAVTR